MKYCNFCGRSEEEVTLINGNNCCICTECAELAHKYISEYKEESFLKNINEVPKPKDIKDFIDKYVIGQNEAKEKISVAVYNHYKRIYGENIQDDVEIEKSNVLVVGPTGTGKTYIAKTIAKLLDVPFTIVDCTSLTQAGYVGDDVENILTRLLQAADYDIEKAERGIVFIDEIDKIGRKSGNPSIARDVSGEGVQQALLKIIEGTIVGVPPQGGRKHPEQPLIYVNTNNILFICGGAFEGLDKIVENRYNINTIGYITDERKEHFNSENPLKYVIPEDLKSFGLIPELIGRLPVITYMNNLTENDLKRILIEPKNALIKQYQKLFSFDGIELKFNDDVCGLIAKKAAESKIGARGLRMIMEDIMAKIMFELPSSDKKSFTITKKYANKYLDDLKYK